MSGKTAILKATATDDQDVPEVEFFVDWDKVATRTAPPYEVTVDLSNHPRKYAYIYARAFDDVHDTITSRNDMIRNQLDKIGPKVADQVERLKLAIKAEQDTMGPEAEEEINQALHLVRHFVHARHLGALLTFEATRRARIIFRRWVCVFRVGR